MSERDSPLSPADGWLTPERYQRLHELVEKAAEQPPFERRAFVVAGSAQDERFRLEALALLEACEALEKPAPEFAPGARIGAYRVEREVGRGGMGSVYLARRADESYDKQVAIKLIRPDVGSQETLARFTLERKILASLGHPNIAGLLDGGAVDDGRPYIVMEFVDGVPITQYADRTRMTLRERVGLFRTVCAAVDHAHQRLIVHRDIKPSNILVTAEGTPKLLDFGIAKLLTAGGRDAARLTATLLNPGTPLYASPEQLDGELVSTGADVYALGVVLYELLTGCWPFDPRNTERPRVVPAPSITIASPPECGSNRSPVIAIPSAVASARGTTTGRLARQLRGDLDAIAVTALGNSVHERYRSVAELSEDLERYLQDMPIGARPHSTMYRGLKFVARNRAAVVATALAALTLTGGIVSTYYQWQRAEAERGRAERRFDSVRSLASSVLDVSGSFSSDPRTESARQALVLTSLRYLEGLEREAGTDRVLLREVVAGYRRVGDAQRQSEGGASDSGAALSTYRRALRMSEQLAAAEPQNLQTRKDLAISLEKVGTALAATGDQQAGRQTLERSLALYQDLLNADRTSADAQRDLMLAHLRYADAIVVSDPDAARISFEQARQIAEALVARDPENADATRDLALARDRLRDLELNANPELARQQEDEYFAAIRETQDPARLEYFLQRFPNSARAIEVNRRLTALRGRAPPDTRKLADQPEALVAIASPPPASPAPMIRPAIDIEIDIDWRAIPAGRFEMGCDLRPDRLCRDDERPRHWVTISRPFRMAATETTLASYRTYAKGAGQAVPEQPVWNTSESSPVVNITWEQARQFCFAIGGRLPIEAEWEWAARGGRSDSVYPWGDAFERGRANAGFPGRDGWDRVSPAGTFPSNGYGLFDMTGNVWEWVSDWYAPHYYEQAPEVDPTGSSAGSSHVLRGGSYNTSPAFLRLTQRGVDSMDRRREATGFRCVQ